MRSLVLITFLAALLAADAVFAQSNKLSLPKVTALSKAFRPNASKAENLEAMRRTLGISPDAKLEWLPGINGVDTMSVLDDFNRTHIGDDWAIDQHYWEIKDGELVLKPEAIYEWRFLATYKPIYNNLERRIYSVSYRWGKKADALGIREGAHAIMLDRPSHISSGYWIWHRTNWQEVWMYVIKDGTWEAAGTPQNPESIEIDRAKAQTHNPVAGDVVKVIVRPEKTANFFDYYINQRFDATVKDEEKRFPPSNTWYAGLFIHGESLNNQVDDFKITWLQGDGFTPAAVFDLTVTKVTPASVTLEWTAPGDNGFEGQAKSYDIRYSTNRILTDVDFAAASPVPDRITPGPGGRADRLVIAGLQSGKTYYFAMKTTDEAGNVSDLSNEVSARLPALLPVVDTFNRANGNLGSNWAGDLTNVQIRNNATQNINAAGSWGAAVYQNARNIIEVSLKYAPTATVRGIGASGILLLANTPAATVNGYMIQRDSGADPATAADDMTRLWIVQNGRPDQIVDEGRSQSGFSPKAGAKITVRIIDIDDQRYFYVYVDGVFDRVLKDERKTFNGLYAGFMLDSGAGDQNAIDEFSAGAAPGKPKALSMVSGDGQFGEIGKELPFPLTVALIDSFNNPLAGADVRFAVTSGTATIPLPPSPDGNLRIEAEDGEIVGPLAKVKDNNAAFGQYLVYPTGQNADASATFTFNISKAGAYRVWTRSMKTGSQPGSWSVQIDNGPKFIYDVFQGRTRSVWTWDLLSERGTGDGSVPQFDPKIINFSAVEHKLIFHARWDDTRLDQIVITADPSFEPIDKEEAGFRTDANGEAGAVVKFGMTLQPVTIEASHGTVKPVVFKLQPISNEKPQTIAAFGGNAQSGPAGQTLQPFKVILKDKNGNGVAGQQVTWVVTAGNGTLSQYLSSTNLEGVAETVLTLGNIAATNTVEARANLLTGTNKIVFNATTISGLAVSVAAVAGNGQSGTVGAVLPQPLPVKVLTATGQAVPNFPIAFKVMRGGGSLNPHLAISNEGFETMNAGLNLPADWDLEGAPNASEVFLSTLGPRSGAKSLQVSSDRDGVGISQSLNYPAAGSYTLSFYAKVNSGTAHVVWRLNAANGTPVDKIIDITALATGNAWTPFVITASNGTTTPRILSFKTSGAGNFLIDDVKIFRNTDASGQISVNWTLGDTAMTQVMRAEVPPSGMGNTALAGSPVIFSAIANAGAAKKLVAVSGNNQNGGQDQFLSAPLVARVSDDYVNGVPGRSVTFTVKSGDGKLNGDATSFTTTSDAGGLARANLKLGPAAKDTVKVEASSPGLTPVIFNAIAAVPSQVTKVAGAPTTGSAGIRLSKPLIVRVADALGKPISGYPVLFTVTQGGGHFNGKTQAILLTDSTGQARAFPVLGTAPGGQNRFQAVISYSGQTLPALPITFLVRAVGLKAMSAVSGSGQTGNTCEPLAQPFKVKVVDSLDVGVKGQAVKFTVAAGNGNFSGANTKEILTDSLGVAAATLTLGEKAVANQVTVSMALPLIGSPQTFTAAAQLGKASVLRKVAGDSLTGQVNAVLPSLLVARVTDKCAANGIAGIPVTFIVKTGGGKVNGKDTVTVVSDASGKAQVAWQLGPLAGLFNNRVEAKAPFSNSLQTFVASANAGGARSMNIKAGNQQRGRAGEALPNPLVVRVIDGSNGIGNIVKGHRVRFVVTRGGGKFSTGSKDTTVITDANGESKVFWILGGAVGINAQEVRAVATNSSGGNLENSPLIFTAHVNGSDPSAEGSVFQVNSPTPVPADGETKCSVTVYVRDRFGNPVQGLALTFMVSGGPNSIEQPTALTDSLGRATCRFSSTRAEVKTVTAKILGGIDLTRGITVPFVPTAARNISLVSGNGQACNVKSALPNPLKVKVGDKFNNGVANHEVRFVVKGEGRILESGPIKTDDKGVASANFVAGTNTGQTQIWAESSGLTNSPVIFVATVTKTPAQRLLESSGNAQRGRVNQVLPEPVVVRVTDGFGRPVYGVLVKIRVTFGDGTVEGRSSQLFASDELGEVRVNWRLGPRTGVNTLRFEVEGLAGSPIDFRADATADVAAILQGTNCGSVSGPVGGTTPQPLTVQVTDASGNGVDSVDVLFELLQGTGSFSSRDQIRVMQMTTKNGGFASVPITFGNESGYRRVRVSAEGLSGSPMTCRVYGRALAPQTMEIIARTNNQRGTKGKPLNFPLQVLVKDRLGNPVPNENLSFLITVGGGDFNGVTPFTARTDSNGIAAAPWTLGRFAVANEATVVRNGLLPSTLVFKATGFDNNFPVFAEVPDRRVTEGDVIEFKVSATDADGEPLKYGAKNLPPGAQFDSLGTQVFRWATDPNSEGRYEVSFFARDPRGGLDEAFVVIEVKNRNQQPIIYSRVPAGNINPSLPDTTLEIVNGVGTMLMRVNALDPDGDGLSFRWFVNGKYAGSATSTFFFRSAERFNTVEALVFDQEDTARTQWLVKVPVQLSGLSAVLESDPTGGKRVSLRWSTGAETNNAGFNVLRSSAERGRYEKINRQLIPPRHDGQYVFVDDNVEAGGRYFYKLQDIDLQGNVTEHGPVSIAVAAPESYVLQQNYPNPFNPTTQIRYELPRSGYVSLTIFNALGQEVRRLVEKQQAAGYYDVTWNGRDQNGKPVPSGVYHYRLQVGDFVTTKKMLMAK